MRHRTSALARRRAEQGPTPRRSRMSRSRRRCLVASAAICVLSVVHRAGPDARSRAHRRCAGGGQREGRSRPRTAPTRGRSAPPSRPPRPRRCRARSPTRARRPPSWPASRASRSGRSSRSPTRRRRRTGRSSASTARFGPDRFCGTVRTAVFKTTRRPASASASASAAATSAAMPATVISIGDRDLRGVRSWRRPSPTARRGAARLAAAHPRRRGRRAAHRRPPCQAVTAAAA